VTGIPTLQGLTVPANDPFPDLSAAFQNPNLQNIGAKLNLNLKSFPASCLQGNKHAAGIREQRQKFHCKRDPNSRTLQPALCYIN